MENPRLFEPGVPLRYGCLCTRTVRSENDLGGDGRRTDNVTAAGLHVVNLEVALTSGDKAAAEREVTRVLHRDERSAVALQEHLTEGGADAATTHEEPSVVNRTGGGVVADRTQSRERHSVD